MSLIKTENPPHVVVNLQFAKIWRGLRPLHFPAGGRNKIALMCTVPSLGCSFHKGDPTESDNKVGGRK